MCSIILTVKLYLLEFPIYTLEPESATLGYGDLGQNSLWQSYFQRIHNHSLLDYMEDKKWCHFLEDCNLSCCKFNFKEELSLVCIKAKQHRKVELLDL